MLPFISWLNDRVGGVDLASVKPPQAEIQKGEIEIGEIIDQDVKRLFGFLNVLRDECDKTACAQMHRVIDTISSVEPLENLEKGPLAEADARFTELTDLYQTVAALFWTVVKRQLCEKSKIKLAQHDQIRLAKGWKIVACESPPVSSIQVIPMPGTLASILGRHN